MNIFPAISRDGKLLAYSSDRGGSGHLNLWIQPLDDGTFASGSPIQITHGTGDDITPDFSPDGMSVVFRGNRERPGLYMVSTFGSEERRLTDTGWCPRFSPDGKWIAFDGVVTQGSGVYVIPARGGEARVIQIRKQFQRAGYPVWTPDGDHLIVVGIDGDGALDWWLIHRDGGDALRLGIAAKLKAQGVKRLGLQDLSVDWRGGEMVIALRGGDVANLWGLPMSRTPINVVGPARRLTFGSATTDLWPRMSASGRIVFSSDFRITHLWSLGLANPNSPLEQLTVDSSLPTGGVRAAEGFSAGKGLVVFSSRRSGNSDIWAKELQTGKEWSLAATPEAEEHPLLSPDELSVAYMVSPGSHPAIYVLDMKSRRSRKLCTDCGPL